jgi:hypothetical protein
MEPDVLDTIYIHGVNLALSTGAIIILLGIYLEQLKKPKNDFALYMILLPLVAAIHFGIYSIVLVIDHWDRVVIYPLFYNVWSLFLFTQVLLTILWLAIIAHRKITGGNKNE